MKRALLYVAFAVVAAALACGTLEGSSSPDPPGDGGTADAAGAVDAPSSADGPIDAATPPPPPCNTSAPWGTPTLVLQRSDFASGVVALSDDEHTIFFDVHVTPPSRWTIYSAERASLDVAFAGGAEIANVPFTDHDVLQPGLSADGRTLYYTSNASGCCALQSYHLWTATRPTTSAAFVAPALAPNLFAGTGSDYEPFVTAEEIWFASSRAPATASELDLYRAPLVDGGFGAPVRVAELSSSTTDAKPVLSRDGLTIFFASTRPPSAGYDIWTSTRTSTSTPFAAPSQVTELETAQSDVPTWISGDSCRLYIISDRDASGVDAIYVAARPP